MREGFARQAPEVTRPGWQYLPSRAPERVVRRVPRDEAGPGELPSRVPAVDWARAARPGPLSRSKSRGPVSRSQSRGPVSRSLSSRPACPPRCLGRIRTSAHIRRAGGRSGTGARRQACPTMAQRTARIPGQAGRAASRHRNSPAAPPTPVAVPPARAAGRPARRLQRRPGRVGQALPDAIGLPAAAVPVTPPRRAGVRITLVGVIIIGSPRAAREVVEVVHSPPCLHLFKGALRPGGRDTRQP